MKSRSSISLKCTKRIRMVNFWHRTELVQPLKVSRDWLAWSVDRTGSEPQSDHSCDQYKIWRAELKKIYRESMQPESSDSSPEQAMEVEVDQESSVSVIYVGQRPPSHNEQASFKVDVEEFVRHHYVGSDILFSTKWRGFANLKPSMEKLDSALRAPNKLKNYIDSLNVKSRQTLLARSHLLRELMQD